MMLMAGEIAEDLLTGRTRVPVGSGHDRHEAVDLLSYLSADNELPPYYEWLRQRTKTMLTIPLLWAAVEALAIALTRERQIDGRRCRAIIQSAVEKCRKQS